MKKVIFLIIVLFFNGCSIKIKDVKPWQKGVLAKESMSFSGGNNLFRAFQNHIYFSKEATKGGIGVSGGGCGCN